MSTFNIKKILVPIDFSGTGEKVLEQAVLMAKKAKAAITLVHILEGPLGNAGPDYFGISIYNRAKYETEILKWAKKHMEELKAKLSEQGVKVDYLIETGTPHKKVLEVAKRTKADIILMGTHGVSGVREFIIGSNTFRVVSEAKCPVLSIQKHVTKAGFKQILLPFRDKPHSREKVDYAASIAKLYGATIHVLGISYDTDPSAVKKIQLEADQIKLIIEKEGIKCTEEVVKGNYIAKLIFKHAQKKNADLIVVMSDLDMLNISEFVAGPFVQQLVNHSQIPVLSIRPIFDPNPMVNASDWTFWA